MRIIIIAVVLIVAIPLAALFLMSTDTVVTVKPDVKVIGLASPVSVQIANPHGVRRVSAYLDQNGARWLIVFEGVNDIAAGAGAPSLTQAYARFVDRAHARRLRAYGATITPFGRPVDPEV